MVTTVAPSAGLDDSVNFGWEKAHRSDIFKHAREGEDCRVSVNSMRSLTLFYARSDPSEPPVSCLSNQYIFTSRRLLLYFFPPLQMSRIVQVEHRLNWNEPIFNLLSLDFLEDKILENRLGEF